MKARIARTLNGFTSAGSKSDWLRMRAEWLLFRAKLMREEYKNRSFDRRYGTETAAEMPLNAAGVLGETNTYGVYRPFWAGMFHKVMRLLPIEFPQHTFVDIGSGKGKLLLLASEYPFRAIEGVEYAARLHESAERNIKIYKSPSQKCTSITARLGDARTYDIPSGPVVCLIFNALDEVTNNCVLNRIAEQAQDGDRAVYVIYANLRSVVERSIGRGGACPPGLKVLHHARKVIVLGNAQAEQAWVKAGRHLLAHGPEGTST